MAELWTFSGINSYDANQGEIVDYVGEKLRGKVQKRPSRRYASELGTMPFCNDEQNVAIRLWHQPRTHRVPRYGRRQREYPKRILA